MSAFEWILPERFRKRKPIQDSTALALLAGLQDNDPILLALMELVSGAAEDEARRALEPVTLTWLQDGKLLERDEAQARAYQCGRAAALAGLIERIENARAEAREWAKAQAAKVTTEAQRAQRQ